MKTADLTIWTGIVKDAERAHGALRRYLESLEAVDRAQRCLDAATEDLEAFGLWPEEVASARRGLKSAVSYCHERWAEIVSDEHLAWSVWRTVIDQRNAVSISSETFKERFFALDNLASRILRDLGAARS